MGLILWGCILLMLVMLDRFIVSAAYHNRRGYQRRKKLSMARR